MRDVDEIKLDLLNLLRLWQTSRTPLSRRALCQRLECQDRVLRRAVEELRRKGYLVIADEGGGYRLALSLDEVMGYTATLKSRIRALRQIVDRMETTAVQVFQNGGIQERLF